jgi:hypothetical protein
LVSRGRSINRHFARLPSVAAVAALTAGLIPSTFLAATVAPPFTQCPPVGLSPSCGSLLVINPDTSVSVFTDPSVSPFDGIEDTLIGVQNNSAAAVGAITAFGPPGIFGFDGDGLCSGYVPGPSGCPFGPTKYEGPGVAFVPDPTNNADGEIDFAGAGILAGGSAYFSLEGAVTSATLKAVVGRLSFCKEAGQMQTQASVTSDGWSLNYGISKCEGLVVSHVALGQRLMDERMSLPYLDLVTCSSILGTFPCTGSVTRHITLRTDQLEAQSDPSAYTRVHLLGPASVTKVPPPSTSPCNGRMACAYTAVEAGYRVDLTPATGSGPPATYLDVTQRYEFYRKFSEKQFKDIACEPSQSGPSLGPLPDCGRWKPLVKYQFHDSTGSTLLVSLNAGARLHMTPDALAVRASTFIRDCDLTGPSTGCFPPVGPAIELFPPGNGETSMQKESVIRGLVAGPAGTSTLPGRYDNLHQTPSSFVLLPLPPPGCPECVHMHWRWTNTPFVKIPPFFGQGQPLIGDAEPAAQPNPASHQQLDVAMVAYHSEELAPANYIQLVQGANPNQLTLTPSSDYNVAGFTRGSETLEYPSGSCSFRPDLTSWGRCGEVAWLSATTMSTVAHDEDKDTLFAFGGFFCEVCGQTASYSAYLPGFVATYMENGHPSQSRTFAVGSKMTIQFLGVNAGVEFNDVLPPGLVGVTAIQGLADKNGHSIPGVPRPTSCPVTTNASGQQIVTCESPTGGLGGGVFDQVTITATVGNIAPGTYSNTVHGIWGGAHSNTEPGGNFKSTDDITITP